MFKPYKIPDFKYSFSTLKYYFHVSLYSKIAEQLQNNCKKKRSCKKAWNILSQRIQLLSSIYWLVSLSEKKCYFSIVLNCLLASKNKVKQIKFWSLLNLFGNRAFLLEIFIQFSKKEIYHLKLAVKQICTILLATRF